jgi:WhiB family redox-sensing transcriptional regulator
MEYDDEVFWEGYEDETIPFDQIVEYVGPNRLKVEAEINRLMSRLVRGSTVEIDWSEAACKGQDPNLWFCPGDTQPAASAADICFTCPIRLKCLEFSCAAGERYGTWGGVPENMRAGKGEGYGQPIKAYDYPTLARLPNVYDVQSRRFRYHRSRLKPWKPGQELSDEVWESWLEENQED